MKDIYQIKLLTGQEIIANVLEWDPAISSAEVNNVLEMIPMEDLEGFDLESNKAYYILKPWITYTDSLGKSTTVNTNSIVCMTRPSEVVAEQYYNSLAEIITSMKDEEKTEREKNGNVVSFTPKNPPTLLTE